MLPREPPPGVQRLFELHRARYAGRRLNPHKCRLRQKADHVVQVHAVEGIHEIVSELD